MAAKRKSKNNLPPRERLAEWALRLRPFFRLPSPKMRRHLLRTVMTTAFVAAVVFVFHRLERRVHALPQYDRVLALEWMDVPDWLRYEDNRHILKTLTQRVNLSAEDHLLDASLAQRLGQTLSEPSIGWIKSVDRVTVRPDGVVAIRCQFRRPAAWVVSGDRCYLVDGESTRLPGSYSPQLCGSGSLFLINGVAIKPPTIGSTWDGADLVSAIRLATLIQQRPFRHQVTEINVANYEGRADRRRPHIELVTDLPGSRIWWGRAPERELGMENSALQKLTLLEVLFRKKGRIDAGRAYVDVRTHPVSVEMPLSAADLDMVTLAGGSLD